MLLTASVNIHVWCHFVSVNSNCYHCRILCCLLTDVTALKLHITSAVIRDHWCMLVCFILLHTSCFFQGPLSSNDCTDPGKPCNLKLEIFQAWQILVQFLESLEIQTLESWKFIFPRELIHSEEINVYNRLYQVTVLNCKTGVII